jgi:hypothetical protein
MIIRIVGSVLHGSWVNGGHAPGINIGGQRAIVRICVQMDSDSLHEAYFVNLREDLGCHKVCLLGDRMQLSQLLALSQRRLSECLPLPIPSPNRRSASVTISRGTTASKCKKVPSACIPPSALGRAYISVSTMP